MVKNEVQSVAEKIMNKEQVNNNFIGSFDNTRHNRNDRHRKTVEQLNKIM